LIELLKSWSKENELDIKHDNIEEKTLSETEIINLLKLKVNETKPEFFKKFDNFSQEVLQLPNKDIILKKIYNFSDEIFFEYLENKNIDELIEICKTIK
jgi:hypothetical protein